MMWPCHRREKQREVQINFTWSQYKVRFTYEEDATNDGETDECATNNQGPIAEIAVDFPEDDTGNGDSLNLNEIESSHNKSNY